MAKNGNPDTLLRDPRELFGWSLGMHFVFEGGPFLLRIIWVIVMVLLWAPIFSEDFMPPGTYLPIAVMLMFFLVVSSILFYYLRRRGLVNPKTWTEAKVAKAKAVSEYSSSIGHGASASFPGGLRWECKIDEDKTLEWRTAYGDPRSDNPKRRYKVGSRDTVFYDPLNHDFHTLESSLRKKNGSNKEPFWIEDEFLIRVSPEGDKLVVHFAKAPYFVRERNILFEMLIWISIGITLIIHGIFPMF